MLFSDTLPLSSFLSLQSLVNITIFWIEIFGVDMGIKI